MNNLYARAVFFVTSAKQAEQFYTEQLGFAVDWRSPDGGSVLQVSLFGFELILEEAWDATLGRVGHGRVYIGLEDDQIGPMRTHIAGKAIKTERIRWGRETLVVRDQDGNELYFWDWPEKQRA
jgi:catechol 2,3-dioxygenase-like lactoylglutathione lyase family enzyme